MERRRFMQTVAGGAIAFGTASALGSAAALAEDPPQSDAQKASRPKSGTPAEAEPPAGDTATQAQFGVSGQRDFTESAPSAATAKPSAFRTGGLVAAYKLRLAEWNPNIGYPMSRASAANTTNRYTLFMPSSTLGNQQDNEIMPLRTQWAANQRTSDIGPDSDSWQLFQELYSYQFGEQKTLALLAPELSYVGPGSNAANHYNFGKYIRMTNLYVHPDRQPDYEKFVHTYIVPAAEKILTQLDQVTGVAGKVPPPNERSYWRLPAFVRVVAVNVNMPTIPEFEIFTQRYLVSAAEETNTAMLCYRTVSGTRHNYYFLYPFNEHKELQYSRDTLVASALLREHQLQIVAKRSGQPVRILPTALGAQEPEINQALQISSDLSEQFHGHAIELEEIVYRIRPDLSARLDQKFTKESIDFVKSSLRA